MLKIIPVIECSAVIAADPEGEAIISGTDGLGINFDRYVRRVFDMNGLPTSHIDDPIPHVKVKLTETDDDGKLRVDMGSWSAIPNVVAEVAYTPWIGYIPDEIVRQVAIGCNPVYTIPFNTSNDSDPGSGEIELRITLSCPSRKERDRLRSSIIDQRNAARNKSDFEDA